MNFLLDTVTVSESAKRRPHENVVGWLRTIEDERLYLSVLTIGEIAFGVERLSKGVRRDHLEDWVEHTFMPWLSQRILAVDDSVCRRWGLLRVSYPNAKPIDALIASTALVHGLTLVTRNVKDFAFDGLSVFNPWTR